MDNEQVSAEFYLAISPLKTTQASLSSSAVSPHIILF